MFFRASKTFVARGLQSRLTMNSLAFPRYFATGLDPTNKNEYAGYVDEWATLFKTTNDPFELERGLNHIFAADWIPDAQVIQEALKCARRMNCFASSVRILEALENKIDNKNQYEQYKSEHLGSLISELGVVDKKEFGTFKTVRDKMKWWY